MTGISARRAGASPLPAPRAHRRAASLVFVQLLRFVILEPEDDAADSAEPSGPAASRRWTGPRCQSSPGARALRRALSSYPSRAAGRVVPDFRWPGPRSASLRLNDHAPPLANSESCCCRVSSPSGGCRCDWPVARPGAARDGGFMGGLLAARVEASPRRTTAAAVPAARRRGIPAPANPLLATGRRLRPRPPAPSPNATSRPRRRRLRPRARLRRRAPAPSEPAAAAGTPQRVRRRPPAA